MAYTKDYLISKDKSWGEAGIVVPEEVRAGADAAIRAEFTVGPRGLKKGSILRLEVPHGWVKTDVENEKEAGYTGFVSRIRLRPFTTLYHRLAYCELLEDAPAGTKIRIVYNKKRAGKVYRVASQVAYCDPQQVHLDVRPDGEAKYLRVASGKTKIVGGEAVSLFIKASTVVSDTELFSLQIAARDEFDNIAEAFSGVILLSAPANIRLPRKKITIGKNDRGKKAIGGIRFVGKRIPDSSGKDLLKKQDSYFVFPPPPEMGNVCRIQARSGKEKISGRSHPIYRTKKNEAKKVYWGDIHVHTRSFSDGMGSGNDAYHYMKEVSMLDFGGLGDHSFQGSHNVTSEAPKRDLHISPEEWKEIIKLAEINSVPGKFIGVPGYEWSGRRFKAPKDWPYEVVSDKCVYFADYDEKNPILYQNRPDGNTPEKFYRGLKNTDALIVSHSSASASMGTAWETVDNRVEPVVEIYSMHGTGEYYGNPRPLISHRRQGYVTEALKKGLKLGFIGGGDDHFTHPGCRTGQRKFITKMICTIYRPGLAAVITDDFSLKGIIEAIRRRHCYATTGERIWLNFRIGPGMMGDEIGISRPPVIEVACAGTDTLQKVEIVRDGETIFCRATIHDKLKLNFIDEKVKKGESYYYLRVTQADGEMAWSSPIWVRLE